MLGLEVSPVVQYVIAFAIIAALLGLFAIVLRRIGGKRFTLPGQDRGRGRQPRLGIVDVYDLDRQRQLVLLRRDNVEHLVMLGGPNDLVVESNIVRMPVARAPAGNDFPTERLGHGEPGPGHGRTGFEPAIAASAGGAVNGLAARNPEPAQREPSMQQRSQQAPPATPRQQPPQRPAPARPGPEIRPSELQPATLRPSTPSPAAPQNDVAEASAPQAFPQPSAYEPASLREPAPLHEPAPQVSAQPARPAAEASSHAAQAEAARSSAPKSFEPVVTTAPTPPEPKRSLFGFGRAVETPAPMPAFPSRPRATPVAPDFTPQRTPPKFAPAGNEKPALAEAGSENGDVVNPASEAKQAGVEKSEAQGAAPKSGRPLDDALLSDMAKQLEAALKRPASAAKPPLAQRPAQPSAAPRAAAAPTPPASAPPSPAPPSAPPPSPADDWPSEPKLYRPAVSAAAAAVGAAMASALRPSSAAEPRAPSSPVPPMPYGGSDAADKNGPESRVEEKPRVVSEDATPASTGDGVASGAAIEVRQDFETEMVSSGLGSTAEVRDERSNGDEVRQEEKQAAAQSEQQELRSEMQQPRALEAVPVFGLRDEPVDESIEAAERPDHEREQEGDAEEPVKAAEAAQPAEGDVEAVAISPAEEATRAEEAAPEEAGSAQAATEEAAASGEKQEPAPTSIDPFSVDEIEAEFARLLGRSVEKDTKNL